MFIAPIGISFLNLVSLVIALSEFDETENGMAPGSLSVGLKFGMLGLIFMAQLVKLENFPEGFRRFFYQRSARF